jgi:hypothetical protein
MNLFREVSGGEPDQKVNSGALPMTDTPPPFVLWRPGNIIDRVSCEPRLASWNKKSHPDQIRLAAYLDEVTAGLGRLPDALLYLEVIVRVRKAEHLLRHHDLENYLQPLIDRLGQQRFCYATARKQLNQPSEVRIGRAGRPAACNTRRPCETVSQHAPA